MNVVIPQTLEAQLLEELFLDDDQCLELLFLLRFPDVQCPKCHRRNAYHRNSAKHCFTCACGKHQIYPCAGTTFERSAIPLSKWFYATFLLSAPSAGISAKELERQLGVVYPTARRMRKRIQDVGHTSSLHSVRPFEALLHRAARISRKMSSH